MRKTLSIFSLLLLSLVLNAATTQDILAFKNSGDSSAWYHELIRDAYNAEKRAATEKIVLDAMKNPKISDDAFRLSAKIMKFAVTEKNIPELFKLATSPNRTASVFDILISAEYPSVDAHIINALKNSRDEDFLIHAAYVLGARNAKDAVAPLWDIAVKGKPVLTNTCITAIGHIDSPNSYKAILDLAKKRKGDPFYLDYALSQQRELLIAAGNAKEAYSIATSEPNFVPGLLSLANSQPNGNARMKFLDKNFIDPKLPGRHAARIANTGRTFENSGDLIKAYPKLEDGAKIAATRSFALSGDKRFFDTIKDEVRDSSERLNVEAIFACAYIAPDSVIPQLESLLTSSSRDVRIAATYALTIIPSAGVDKALKASYAKSKSPAVLDILLDRSNDEMRDELFKRMFDPNDPNRRDIVRIFENQVGFGGLAKTTQLMLKADEKVRKDALGAIIKFVSKDKNTQFRMQIFADFFENSGLTDDELAIIKERLQAQKK